MIRRRMTVKRVDPWSVLKLGLVVNIAGAAILVVTGVVVWSVVRRLQLVERVCEQAQGLLGFESCAVDGVEIMRTGLMLAGLSVVVATGVMVFLAFLYNLIADLTGGIEVSMLDQTAGQQPRTVGGGVELAPELQTEPRGRPVTGAPRAAATTASRMDPHPTMASATARPQTDVPLVDSREPAPRPAPPMASTPSGPSAWPPSSTAPATSAAPEPEDADELSGPGVLERATAAAGAAGAAVKGVAERSGAAVRTAAHETGAKISDAGRRATTTLADVTEVEAAERAARARSQRDSLDQLAATPDTRSTGGGSDGAGRGSSRNAYRRSDQGSDGSSDGLPPRDDDGRFVSTDDDRSSGPTERESKPKLSPQEAAAERQKAKVRRNRESENRSNRDSRSDRRSSDDDEPELIFGNHPRASSDD